VQDKWKVNKQLKEKMEIDLRALNVLSSISASSAW